MIDTIEALASCIMEFEGWKMPGSIAFPRGSTSWRNRNPGNLRDSIRIPHKIDEKGYCIFYKLSDGWDALIIDLQAKFAGSHNLTPQSTLHDLFSIYAPVLDQNDPTQYSRQIASWMGKIYNAEVTPDWKLEDILKLGK